MSRTSRPRPGRVLSIPAEPGRPARRAAPRAVCCALAAALLAAALTGCAGFDKAFGKREAIVVFRQGTPDTVRMAVRAACSHVPQAAPEPLPADKKLSDDLNNVRYRIDHASDAQLAELETCLNKFPSVAGVQTPQDENS